MNGKPIFRGVARNITQQHGAKEYWYHKTCIASFKDNYVILDSGGWETATTKKAMNQALRQEGFPGSVFQTKNRWYVKDSARVCITFRGWYQTISLNRSDEP